VRGRAKGRRDLVLVVQSGSVPGMDGVIFEAGEDHVGQGHKEHLRIQDGTLVTVASGIDTHRATIKTTLVKTLVLCHFIV